MPIASFLTRYQAGECEQVWADLLALGAQVRLEPAHADALAVARETMRRARQNIEILIARLAALGYEFGYRWTAPISGLGAEVPARPSDEEDSWTGARPGDEDGEAAWNEEGEDIEAWARTQPPAFTPPKPGDEKRIAALEELAGPIPLSLRAWYEVVGSVNFVGYPSGEAPAVHIIAPTTGAPMSLGAQGSRAEQRLYSLRAMPHESYGARGARVEEGASPPHGLDPLYVMPIETALARVQGQLRLRRMPAPICYVPIAPDEYYKYYISGGGQYMLRIPDPNADGLLLGEWHNVTFVGYLRICFRNGGLPGLELLGEQPNDALQYLVDGLLPV